MRLASTKWKAVNGKPHKINESILKTKADLKKIPDSISEGGDVRLKLDDQCQGGRILDVAGQGVGGLEDWTISLKVICVLSLKKDSKSFIVIFGTTFDISLLES